MLLLTWEREMKTTLMKNERQVHAHMRTWLLVLICGRQLRQGATQVFYTLPPAETYDVTTFYEQQKLEQDVNTFAYVLRKALGEEQYERIGELAKRGCSILFDIVNKGRLISNTNLPAPRLAVQKCVKIINQEIGEMYRTLLQSERLSNVMRDRADHLKEAAAMAAEVSSHCHESDLPKLGEAQDYVRHQLESLREDAKRTVS